MPNLLSPFVVINILIAVYSYAFLPLLLDISLLSEMYVEKIIIIGILAHIAFSSGCLLYLKLNSRKKISPELEYKNIQHSPVIFNAVYILIIAYTLLVMQMAAGSITYFLGNLDQRQIFMEGSTFLIAPLYISKYLFLYEYYVSRKISLHIISKLIFVITLLGLFGRFVAVVLLLQFVFMYLIINQQNITKKFKVISLSLFIFIIFGYGIYRYYTGVFSANQFGGTFLDYLNNLEMSTIYSIIALNFFDGTDVLHKVLITVDQIGLLYGKTFLVAIFKVLPKMSSIVGDYVLSPFPETLSNNGIGQQIMGIIPELYANFDYLGFILFVPMGYYLTNLYYKPKNNFVSIVVFGIIYVNFIQLIRNGSAVFITFIWIDFLAFLLVLLIKRLRMR